AAASAHASALFCNSDLATYSLPRSSARPAKPTRTMSDSATMIATTPLSLGGADKLRRQGNLGGRHLMNRISDYAYAGTGAVVTVRCLLLPAAHAETAATAASGPAASDVHHAAGQGRPRIHERFTVAVHRGVTRLSVDSLDGGVVARGIGIGDLLDPGHVHGNAGLRVQAGRDRYAPRKGASHDRGQNYRDGWARPVWNGDDQARVHVDCILVVSHF